jgi:iron(III) transport system substrate-binding protein
MPERSPQLKGSTMLIRRLADATVLAVTSLSLLASACSPQVAPSTPREVQSALGTPESQLTPAQQTYRTTLKDFNDTVVPAAKKEGTVNWYSCQLPEDTERLIKTFNKYYPDITVNHIYGPGPTLVERIAAEVAAGQVTADTYTCGITSARSLSQRPNVAFAPNPPSIMNPDVKWNWEPMEGNNLLPRWSTNGIAGLTVNTKFVAKDKYPKTWWDLLKDPFWVDLFNRGLVGIADPRASGFGHQILYGLRVLKKDEYGESFVSQLASFKPTKYITAANEIERGERYANIGGSISTANRQNSDPLELVCPAPGCVQSFLAPVSVKGPHPNATRVWTDFWFTKEGQEGLRDSYFTINRTDVSVPPDLDWKNFPQLYFASEEHDKPAADALTYNKESRLWDY